MVHAVGIVVMLVVLGTAVATFAGRWGIPAPSLLVLAGIVVALIPGVPAIHVAPDVIALVVLPPLLYASAEEISARDLRRVWVPVTVLALAGSGAGDGRGDRFAGAGADGLVRGDGLRAGGGTGLHRSGGGHRAGPSAVATGAAGRFLLLAGGGVAVGLVLAASVALVRTRTTDPVLDTVIALVAPYAAYLLAESVDMSGVTAAVRARADR